MGMDGLAALRQRLFDLVAWFGEDVDRLPAAQAVWRTQSHVVGSGEPWWQRRVAAGAEDWLGKLERGQLAAAPLEPATPAEDALLELEALDLAGSLWPGGAHGAPAQIFGAGDRARYVVRLGRERQALTARQPGVLYTHLRFHALVPTQIPVAANATRYRVDVRPLDRGFTQAIARGIVGVATTSFKDGATIEWQAGELGNRAIALRDGDDRAGRLWGAIKAAALDEVDVLVAPELTVTPGVRDGIVDKLRWSDDDAPARPLALLVLGSFHEQLGRRFVNCARLLDGATGNTLLEHHKLVQYGVLDGFVEGIQLGDSITVLATPIGTVAIAICKDFCDYHVGPIWHHIQPDWLLVPAYGGGADAHALASKQIKNMLGTVVVLAHQGDAALGAPFKSFIDDPLGRTSTDCNAPYIMSRKILI